MLVSVIIPVYNVAPYIERCIQSVLNQTYKNLEVIIVDDCGSDNSMALVEKILQEDGNKENQMTVKVLHHDNNRGLSAARNTGIEAASGQYVYFLDSDDWICPECISLMVSAANRHPDSDVVFAGADVTDHKFPWLDYTHKQLPEYSNDRDWLQKSMLLRFPFAMTAWNKLFSLRFIQENNLRFVEGLIHEDEVWNFEVSKHITAASFVPYNTYYYNIRQNSITSVSTDQRFERFFRLLNLMIDSIGGYRPLLQTKAICRFILTETTKTFPSDYRKQLARLFFRLSARSSVVLAPLYLLQGLFAYTQSSKYYNGRITSRIALY